jgi:glycosyltransferase involved in cell wall biosynthesis
MQISNCIYVLITPAHNEEDYIEQTIQSVISQTVLPKKWVIVSDGSTDQTDEIVKKYAAIYDWIEFVRMPEHRDRHFAAKVSSFNAGYERVKEMACDVIGNLDADLSFENDYFAFLLDKLARDPKLGVVGTPFVENGRQTYDYRFTNIEHVSGACQLFRRQCFEAIGGYTPIKSGGIDWIAVTTARMQGWKTRTFTEKVIIHHRPMGTGQNHLLKAKFNAGKKDYCLGNRLVWQIFRVFYQMGRSKPYLLGGLSLCFGYLYALLTRMERPVSQELLNFYRNEQLQRLKAKLWPFSSS